MPQLAAVHHACHCPCQGGKGKAEPLRAECDLCNLGFTFIILPITPSGYVDISLTNLKSGNAVMQHHQTKVATKGCTDNQFVNNLE